MIACRQAHVESTIRSSIFNDLRLTRGIEDRDFLIILLDISSLSLLAKKIPWAQSDSLLTTKHPTSLCNKMHAQPLCKSIKMGSIGPRLLGYVTGTGKPAGLRSRVLRVWVRYPNLYTHGIPCTRATVLRVPTGIWLHFASQSTP